MLRSAAQPDLPAVAPASSPWTPDLGDGRYRNPVLFADYSDPDVVRVGGEYWLTASSFSHVPGLPILHSPDLVNWSLVNHALPALDYTDSSGRSLATHFSVPRHGAGVWAPALRHHQDKFWIYFPDPDHGLYVVTAEDPRGTWSAPRLVKGGRGLIDPCPLWDDDGKVYLVHGWAKSRAGKNNLLTLHELSPDGLRVVDGEGTVIINESNSTRGFHTLEGPKFYRRGETYWIFAPVGGVATGSQAVYRAKTIRGPYEARIVLSQGSTAINGPHQGGWVDTPAGEHWFVHFQDRGAFGRIVHLQPMRWRADGWPTMGTGVKADAECGAPVLVSDKPQPSAAVATRDGRPGATSGSAATPDTSDEFDASVLGRQWQWQANPQPAWFSLTANPGSLRLFAVPAVSPSSLYDAPHLLLQKFPAPAFTATTRLDARGLSTGASAHAGLIVFGCNYAWIGLTASATGRRLVRVVNSPADKNGSEHIEASIADFPSVVFLRVSVDDRAGCQFAYSHDGDEFQPFGPVFAASAGHWVGAKVGLFASQVPRADAASSPPAADAYADFDWIRITS